MDKVKVNKYQKEHLDAFMERYNRGEITASLTVSLEKLADAIKYGYEVEPEFKVGDWVIHKHGDTGIVTEVSKDVLFIEHSCGGNIVWNKKVVRIATPSETAELKERKLLRDLGREFNKYKMADLVTVKGEKGIHEVVSHFDKRNIFVTCDFAISEFLIHVDRVKLVCPAENRLDVKTDE